MTTPAAPATPPVKTPEEIAAEARAATAPQEVINEFFADVVTPPKKPDAAPAAAAPAAPVKKTPVKKTPPKVEPAAAPAPAALDVGELAAEVGKSVAREVLAARAPEPAPTALDALSGLSEEELDQVPVLEKMEAMYPTRYKGFKDKYIANTKAVNEYRTKWQEENPDKEFDPEDNDHDAFFAKHSLDWREGDEMNARAKLIADAEVAEIRRNTDAELDQLRSKDRAREEAPAILTESRHVDKRVWDSLGGEFSKIVKADGTLDEAVIKQIEENDPQAAEIAFPEMRNLNAHFQELIRLDRNVVKLDKENPMHKFLVGYAIAQENAILALPKDKQVDGAGKKYAKSVDFLKMTPGVRAKHWTLGAPELNRMMAAEFGANIKKKIEAQRARDARVIEKLGYVKGNGGVRTPGAAAAAPTIEPEPEVESPETTPVPVGHPGQAPPGGVPKDANGGFFKAGW